MNTTANQRRPTGIVVVAILMILFGLAEITTGFTHQFIGQVSITVDVRSTVLGAGIGFLYACAGLLILTMRKRAATLALACLVVVVVGRVAFVATGLFPLDSFKQRFAIVTGTAIAIGFAVFVAMQRKNFPEER